MSALLLALETLCKPSLRSCRVSLISPPLRDVGVTTECVSRGSRGAPPGAPLLARSLRKRRALECGAGALDRECSRGVQFQPTLTTTGGESSVEGHGFSRADRTSNSTQAPLRRNRVCSVVGARNPMQTLSPLLQGVPHLAAFARRGRAATGKLGNVPSPSFSGAARAGAGK